MPDTEEDRAFRGARNHFHHVARIAKAEYWTNWLRRVEHLRGICPHVAARVVRRRFRRNIGHVAPRLSPDSFVNPSEQCGCMNQWSIHFRDAALVHADAFDARHFHCVRRRVERVRQNRDLHRHVCDNNDAPFTIEELKATLRDCVLDNAPGCDRIRYKALHVDIPWWQSAILQFMELCAPPCAQYMEAWDRCTLGKET